MCAEHRCTAAAFHDPYAVFGFVENDPSAPMLTMSIHPLVQACSALLGQLGAAIRPAHESSPSRRKGPPHGHRIR
jgi:hypothetical protein